MTSATLCFSRWAQRRGRQFHRFQYRGKHRARLLTEKSSVSHLLHTRRPRHLRALLYKLGNVEGEVLGVAGVISGKFSVREMATKSPLVARHDYI